MGMEEAPDASGLTEESFLAHLETPMSGGYTRQRQPETQEELMMTFLEERKCLCWGVGHQHGTCYPS